MAIKIAGTEVINDNKELVLAKLTEINASIADTAVDIFVYDTRKDSDGGAWRKRTQGTSWYNETLNTATRGSRKEFPSVAVIVAETDQSYTIYDGDDPSLPMWMVFQNAGMSGGNVPLTSVFMLNGILCLGGNTSYDGVRRISFIDETFYQIRGSGTGTYKKIGSLSERNTSTLSALDNTTYGNIVNDAVNDVAMTVLPNAPIDAATGLPVPTIAVATDGGVSVIKDDGTVVDITRASSAQISSVDFYNGYLVIGSSNVGAVWYYDYIPSSDETISPSNGHIEYYDSGFSNDDTPAYLGYINTKSAGSYIGTTGNNNSGLTAVDFNNTDYTKSSTAFITSDYNTGWMNGDIKLATLSDTDDTDVVGSELVTNGTFDTDTDWNKGDNWTISGGQASHSSGSSGSLKQTATTVANKTYVLTCEVISSSGGVVLIGVSNLGISFTSAAAGDTGVFSFTFTAPDTTSTVEIYQSSGGSCTVDNITLRLAEEDRSVNGNGLQVFGTVTKNPVNSGADLVGYSGFNASNYLEQPYNSDLDFGTGDFSIITWAKTNGNVNNNQTLFNMGYNSGSTWEYWIALQILGSNGNIRFATAENGSFTTEDAAVDADTGTWTCIVGVRRNGVLEVYKDGAFLSSETGTVRDLTIDANAKSRIGLQLDGTSTSAADDTSIALVRLSATAPSPEQISRIYNDEKHLFTEGSQATLYGSSDAVTALAYDDSTEILSVGTSAGRSDFQGLRRVNNTTNAVGAAISASGGMIVEE